MKVVAIGRGKGVAQGGKQFTQEVRDTVVPVEAAATLKLYLDGKIEQFFFRMPKPGEAGTVFIMNVDSLEHAKTAIESLPLTAGGYMQYEFIDVGPLMPLGMLITGK